MKLQKFLICSLMLMPVSAGFAANLLDAYHDALRSSPDLKQTEALRTGEIAKISESRSALLPQLGLSAGVNQYKYNYKDSYTSREKVRSASLALSQTLFDMAKWRALTLEEKNSQLQDIAVDIARQKLTLTVASNYFSVLSALDGLRYITAQKEAIGKHLEQVTESFHAGLSAITDVESVQAQYDSLLATEITARNNLDNVQEQLRQVTGRRYDRMAALDISRFKPLPGESIAQMIKSGEDHNLTLLQARLSQDLSREQIRYAQAGHLPTVTITASEGITDTRYSTHYSDSDLSKESVALTFSLPLYTGGAVSSRVDQAQAHFVAAGEQLENAHRNMELTVRSAFNSINAAIISIKAYRQAEVSAQAALDATVDGYSVGTRTIVDVLDATSALYNVRQQLAVARYTWVINQLNARSAQGTLNETDIAKLNALLGEEASIPALTP